MRRFVTFSATGLGIAMIGPVGILGPLGPIITIAAAAATTEYLERFVFAGQANQNAPAVPQPVNQFGFWFRAKEATLGLTDLLKNYDFHRAWFHFGRALNPPGNNHNEGSGYSKFYLPLACIGVLATIYMAISTQKDNPAVVINNNLNPR